MSKLYIVPTPIGNMEDISFRALKVLKEVDVVLAEDTRTSGKLMKHFEIKTSLQSHHIHNEHKSIERIVEQLKSGIVFALISDAGTPAISDPGFLLVRACVKNDIEVECLPGPTALIPALVNSGLPTDKFHFEGFLPHKKGRHSRLLQLARIENTIVLYESPHRILKALKQFIDYFGEERPISISREISKVHEETIRGMLKNVIEQLEQKPIKGEIVVVIAGKS
jgi:16S rRNA (cytidine1402-2'-O)-methyltransferase